MEWQSLVSESLLFGAEDTKVLSRSRDNVGMELHDDASGGLAADGEVELYLGVIPVIIMYVPVNATFPSALEE